MTTIKIHGKPYEIPDEVAQCMRMLKDERDCNYETAVALQRKVNEMSKTLNIIRGVTSVKRKKKNTLFT